MNLRHLEVLKAVVETGTATGAAQRVLLTQSAVSRAISGLEQEIGFRLFDRVKKRLILSAEGLAFFQETERLLSGLDELQSAAREIREKRFARTRIIAMPAIAYGLLPDALARLGKTYPQLTASVDISRRGDVTRWIAGGRYDVGFAGLPVNYPGVSFRHLVSVNAVAAVPRGHKLAKMQSIPVNALAAEQLIGLDTTTMVQSKINGYFERHDLSAKVAVESSSLLSVCHFIAAGLGCGIVDPFSASVASGEKIVFRPLKPKLEIEYGVLFPRDRVPNEIVQSLCDHVAAIAKEFDKRSR
jgi:DNA-binding transcriptional LysR family regulator